MLHWAEWVKKEHSLPQILNLSLPKFFEEGFVNKTHSSNKNFKLFWSLGFGRSSVVLPVSNGEGLIDISHNLSMVLDTRFYI